MDTANDPFDQYDRLTRVDQKLDEVVKTTVAVVEKLTTLAEENKILRELLTDLTEDGKCRVSNRLIFIIGTKKQFIPEQQLIRIRVLDSVNVQIKTRAEDLYFEDDLADVAAEYLLNKYGHEMDGAYAYHLFMDGRHSLTSATTDRRVAAFYAKFPEKREQ